MSQMVKCGICGRLYNERYLNSHILRSHRQQYDSASRERQESQLIEKILVLSQKLSDQGRKSLRHRLSVLMRTPSTNTELQNDGS